MTIGPEACVITSWLGVLQELIEALRGEVVLPLLVRPLDNACTAFGEMGTGLNEQVRQANECASKMLALVGDGLKDSPSEFVEQKQVLLVLLDELISRLEFCLVPSILSMHQRAQAKW